MLKRALVPCAVVALVVACGSSETAEPEQPSHAKVVAAEKLASDAITRLDALVQQRPAATKLSRGGAHFDFAVARDKALLHKSAQIDEAINAGLKVDPAILVVMAELASDEDKALGNLASGLSPEDRDKLQKNLDEARAKIAALESELATWYVATAPKEQSRLTISGGLHFGGTGGTSTATLTIGILQGNANVKVDCSDAKPAPNVTVDAGTLGNAKGAGVASLALVLAKPKLVDLAITLDGATAITACAITLDAPLAEPTPAPIATPLVGAAFDAAASRTTKLDAGYSQLWDAQTAQQAKNPGMAAYIAGAREATTDTMNSGLLSLDISYKQDPKSAQAAKQLALMAKATKLKAESEAIEDGMRESSERAKNLMDAATYSLFAGIIGGLVQSSSALASFDTAPPPAADAGVDASK